MTADEDDRDQIMGSIMAAIADLDGEHEWDVARAQNVLRRHPRDAEPALIAALDEGRSSIQVATLLGQVGSEAAVDPLVRAALRGASGLRWHALFALGSLPSVEAFDALVEMARSDRPELRAAAASALPQRAEPEARDLLDALADDVDPEVRAAARVASAESHSERPRQADRAVPD